MSDKDLINRGKVRHEIAAYIYYNTALVDEWAANCIDDIVEEIPAVPQEMSAMEFVIAHHRMCQSGISCDECGITHDGEVPRSCAVLMGLNPDDTVAVVEKWAKEHPEERSEG